MTQPPLLWHETASTPLQGHAREQAARDFTLNWLHSLEHHGGVLHGSAVAEHLGETHITPFIESLVAGILERPQMLVQRQSLPGGGFEDIQVRAWQLVSRRRRLDRNGTLEEVVWFVEKNLPV